MSILRDEVVVGKEGKGKGASGCEGEGGAKGEEEGEVGLLRRQLASLREELADREVAHATELRAAEQVGRAAEAVAADAKADLRETQERCERRLQALQLRLYISDSRVKTLEESLRHLFSAVGPLPDAADADADGQGPMRLDLQAVTRDGSDACESED